MNAGSSEPSRTTRIIRWAGSIIAIVLLVYLLSQQGWDEIRVAIGGIPASRFVLAICLMLISRLAVVWRWHALLSATAMDIRYRDTLRLTFAGLFASNFLPTTVGGDVFRLAGAIQLKKDPAVSAASLVVDRLVGMFGMALALPLGVPPLWAWLASDSRTGDLFGSLNILAVADHPKGWREKLMALVRRFFDSLSLWFKRPEALLMALVATFAHMVCLFAIITLLLGAMADPLPFWQVAGLWSFVYFVTLLPISINGYGVQELALTFFFSRVGGITMQSGLTVALLVRTIQMLASLPGAVFVPAIMAGERGSLKGQDAGVGAEDQG
jgi:uncharacterized membrane protein YbhN (UPF0104 family)